MSIADILKDCETLVDNCGSPYQKEHTKECAIIVIKAQIDMLNNLQLHFDISKNDAIKRCETAMHELEQQLNQLENEQT
jgi:prefoldin subunit 5